jgi:hypothetical protein
LVGLHGLLIEQLLQFWVTVSGDIIFRTAGVIFIKLLIRIIDTVTVPAAGLRVAAAWPVGSPSISGWYSIYPASANRLASL